jgi:hypothetical protein
MEEHPMTMPDTNVPTQDGNPPSDPTSSAGDTFKPITSQDDLNRIITERVSRERSKFSDYDDIKAKAAKFDELDQANKSEIERAQERVAAAEKAAEVAQSEALRLRIAAKHQISDAEDIALFLTGTDEETLTKQAERLAQRTSDRKKQGNHVPREGIPPREPVEDEMREFTRNLFQKTD